MNLRVKALPGVRAQRADPTPEQLALISAEYSSAPVTADDIHVRKARVAHNQVDRTLERFQKAHLDRFAETIRGKSVLPGHDTSALALGKWFDADLRTRTEDFPVLVRQSGKGAEIVPGMETQRQRVTWLEAEFFFINDPSTEGMRKNLDLGVWQDVSIGFSYDDIDCDVCRKSYLRSDCPHYRGQRLDDGSLVTLTYSGDPKGYEAREASLVYLGAQQHAEIIKSLRDGTVDPDALSRCTIEGATHTDFVALKEYEAFARSYGHARKAWAFPSLEPPAPAPAPPPSVDGDTAPPAALAADEEKDMNLIEAARKYFGLPETATEADAEKALETAAQRAQDAETAKAAAEAQAQELEPLAGIGKAAIADLQKTYVDHCVTLGQDDVEAKGVADLYAGDYAKLKGLVERKFAAVCEKFPAGVSGDPRNQEPPAPKSAPVSRAEEVRHLALAG